MKLTPTLGCALVLGAASAPAFAQQLDCNRSFGFRADVNGVAGQSLCESKIDTFLNALSNFSLSNSAYSQTSAATAVGRLNDVNIVFRYDAGSNTLHYNFVELNESGSFTGANRDLSEEQFEDYVENSDLLGRLINYQARNSPTSAITGAGGAIPTIGAADFAAGFDTMSNIGSVGGAGQGENATNNLIGIGLSYGSYNIAGTDDIKTTTLPLSYTVRNDIDPRRQLVLSMPLTKVNTGGAASYHGGIGAAYRFPVTDRWTISPGARYSVVASKDRATVATIMSASLMSTYVIPLGGYHLGIGNMVGVYKTGKFSTGDYEYDPGIDLKLTRNGLLLSLPASFVSSRLSAEVSLIDTRYLGDKPYVASTQEIGITLGTNKRATNARSFTRMGLSYVRGKDTSGFTANLGFWF
ncbi:hypothetical protein [Massilia sp. Leaf139]|uniref:hypothetical protein n=1 Tax=Massilia sp. Leaf139 TaxID=1736272 RepID=UPI0006F9A45E|nr:hypothetical protein [Massilia sp. Leaf139]KQQ87892.1 hypothetical protein ASF77_14255 [Massilia sp. Leaf139]